MRIAIVMLAVVLSACTPTKRQDPIGRYQATANPDGHGVYVLDTTTGELKLCMTGQTNGPGTIGIACMAAGPAFR